VGQDLMEKLNAFVSDAIGLRPEERALVHDLVRIRVDMNNGRLGRKAVRPPTTGELRNYGDRLRSELDSFVEGELSRQHQIDILHDDLSGMIQIDLLEPAGLRPYTSVSRAGAVQAKALEQCRQRLRRQRSQWVYFDRNFRAFDGTRVYVLKPMQRFHWTETQARIDARDIIAESMVRGD